MLIWESQYDDYSNTEWLAPSSVDGELGGPYYWRLSQKLENDGIIWYENHDSDILDDAPCDFKTLEEAKQYIEDLDQEIKNNQSLLG